MILARWIPVEKWGFTRLIETLLLMLLIPAPSAPSRADAQTLGGGPPDRLPVEILLGAETNPDGRLALRYSNTAIDYAFDRHIQAGGTWTREQLKSYLEAPLYSIDEYIWALEQYGYTVELTEETFALLRIEHPFPEFGCAWDLLVTGLLLGLHMADTDPDELINWGGALEAFEGKVLDDFFSCAPIGFPVAGQLYTAITLGIDLGEWWTSGVDRHGINNQIEFYRIYREEWGEPDPFASGFTDDDGYLLPPLGYGYLTVARPYDTDTWTDSLVRDIAAGAYEYYISHKPSIEAEHGPLADQIYPAVSEALEAIDEYKSGALNELVHISQYSAYVNNVGLHNLSMVYVRDDRILVDEYSDTIDVLAPGDAILFSTRERFDIADADYLEFDVLGDHAEVPIAAVLRSYIPGLTLEPSEGDAFPSLAPDTIESRLVILPILPAGDTYAYEVAFGDGSPPLQGETDGTNIEWDHVYGVPGDYDQAVTVSAEGHPADVITRAIRVENPVTAIYPLTDGPSNLLPEVSVDFTAVGSNSQIGGPLSFEWDFDYDGSNFTPAATGESVSHVFSLVGTTDVALRASYGTDIHDISTQTLHVRNPVHVYFAVDLEGGGEVVTASFDACPAAEGFRTFSEIGSITTFAWNFGDGTEGYGQVLSHEFPVGQTYDVTLSATDDHGYASSYQRELDFTDCGTHSAPTNCQASTDRDDGVFVSWEYCGSGHTGFKIERDGLLVFIGTDPAEDSWLDVEALAGVHTYNIYAYSYLGAGASAEVEGSRPGTNWSNDIGVGTTVWTTQNAPYFVTEWMVVKGTRYTPAVLRIEPGVTIRFVDGAGIMFGEMSVHCQRAVLYAEGTKAEPITFTSLTGESGAWAGLSFGASCVDSSIIRHCVIENAGGGGDSGFNVVSAATTLRISHSLLRGSSGAGIQADEAQIDTCEILGNGGEGLILYGGLVQDSRVADNGDDGVVFLGAGTLRRSEVARNGGNGVASATYELCAVESCAIHDNLEAAAHLGPNGYNLGLQGNSYYGNGFEEVFVSGGNLGHPSLVVTWESDGLPYRVTGDVFVKWNRYDPAVLVVGAGTILRFADGAGIKVADTNLAGNPDRGRMFARGTAEQPITFTSLSGSSGGWDGLFFWSPAESSAMEYCIVENAGQTGWSNHGANLYSQAPTSPTLRQCIFRNSSGAGVWVDGSHIDSCTVTGNGDDGLVVSDGIVKSCEIMGNGSTGIVIEGGGTVEGSEVAENGAEGILSTTSSLCIVRASRVNDNTGFAAALATPSCNLRLEANTYGGNGVDEVLVPGGDLGYPYNPIYWSDCGIPYRVLGDIFVKWNRYDPAVLVVEPGTIARFANGAGIQVADVNLAGHSDRGRMIAIGTEDAPITFTSLSGESGDWDGIYFHQRSNGDSSAMIQCVVENAGGSGWSSYGASLYANATGQPTIQDCVFHASAGTGLALTGSWLRIDNCTISGSESHGLFAWDSEASVTNSIVAFSGSGAGVFVGAGAVPVIGCSDVFGNASGNYGGVLGDQTGVSGNISEDPLFCGPDFGDFHLAAQSPCLEGYGCGQMGALGVGCETPTGVPGIFGVSGPEAISGERSIEIRWVVYSIDEGACFYVLRTEGQGDYRRVSEPLIGDDGSYYPRTFSWSDYFVRPGVEYTYRIGVVFVDGRDEVWDRAASASTLVPTQFALKVRGAQPIQRGDGSEVAYDIPVPGADVSIALYDIGGRRVATLAEGRTGPGSYVATVIGRDTGRLGSGIYFLRMEAGSFTATRKIVLLK